MGLFGFNKKYDICPKDKEFQGLVTNYTSKVGHLKINAKLVVPENYYFVLGKKGKVADKFDTGEYFINYSNLPYLCRKYGIDKVKNGKQTDKISADLYFVNKELRGGKFKTYRKVDMGTKAYGLFKAGVIGIYSYRVSDVREFMQSLLNIYDYIKTGEAEDIIESWVGELVVSELEKKNYIIQDVIVNNPIITDNLKIAVGKLFSTAGLELVDLKITKYKLPKEYQEESDRILAEEQKQNEQTQTENEQEFSEMESDLANEIIQQEIQYQISEQEQLGNSENIEETDGEINEGIEEYVPFGNFVFDKNNQEENENHEVKTKRTFVDLNLDKLYDNNAQEVKRCLNCGAENNLKADHCILCGEKFNKEYL